jgi:5-methylcytosine-specific restriction protein A
MKQTKKDKLLLASRSKGNNTEWERLKKRYMILHPDCAVCGERNPRKLVVHHIKPYHIFPELELDEDNLITLCEGDRHSANHHLFVGHLMSYKSFNENVVEDAATWREKIRKRPKWKEIV